MQYCAFRRFLTIFCGSLVLLAALGVAIPAGAIPPAHAPAHGWRRKHDPFYLGYTGRRWSRDYGVSRGWCNRDEIGAILGGVVGGAIGSQIGKGSERAVAIFVGTILGAVIGHEVGRGMDRNDRACAGHALEIAGDGQRVYWRNATTGISYWLTPTGRFGAGDPCRAFTLVTSFGGRSRTGTGRACRASDGTWAMR